MGLQNVIPFQTFQKFWLKYYKLRFSSMSEIFFFQFIFSAKYSIVRSFCALSIENWIFHITLRLYSQKMVEMHHVGKWVDFSPFSVFICYSSLCRIFHVVIYQNFLSVLFCLHLPLKTESTYIRLHLIRRKIHLKLRFYQNKSKLFAFFVLFHVFCSSCMNNKHCAVRVLANIFSWDGAIFRLCIFWLHFTNIFQSVFSNSRSAHIPTPLRCIHSILSYDANLFIHHLLVRMWVCEI